MENGSKPLPKYDLEGLWHYWNQPFLTVSFDFFLSLPPPFVTDFVMVFFLVTFVLVLVTLPSAFLVFVTVVFDIWKISFPLPRSFPSAVLGCLKLGFQMVKDGDEQRGLIVAILSTIHRNAYRCIRF